MAKHPTNQDPDAYIDPNYPDPGGNAPGSHDPPPPAYNEQTGQQEHTPLDARRASARDAADGA